MKKACFLDTLKVISVLLCCLGTTQALAAKYYKWVDQNGTTHYSAQPPAEGVGEVIKVKSGASSDKEEALKRLEERRAKLAESKKKAAEASANPEAEAKKKNADIVKRNCVAYRKNLKVMTENGRVKMADKDGNVKVLPEEERQQKMQDAKKYISENCN